MRISPAAAVLVAFAVLPGRDVHAETLRVELVRAASVVLSGAGLRVDGVMMTSGRVVVRADAGHLAVNGAAAATVARVAADGPFNVDDRGVRADVTLRAEGGLVSVVAALDLEDYVAGVTASEMVPSWPLEALKAQAVAARTYALRQKLAVGIDAAVHVQATVIDQVYRGAGAETSSTIAAALTTKGEVLTFGDEPIEAYFHAACGGRTETALAAFGHAQPYLASAVCGADGDAPKAKWTVRISLEEVAARLGMAGLSSVSITSRSETGRVAAVELRAGRSTRRMTAADFRRLVGYDRIFSLGFSVEVVHGELRFTGSGSGHAVGLCQWGARGMARSGHDYRAMLAHYYPGTELRRMY